MSVNLLAATPFHPYEETRFSAIEEDVSTLQTNEDYQVVYTKQFNMKMATGNSFDASGATITLGTLPATAAILRSYFYIEDVVNAATANTMISMGCKATDDVYGATDLDIPTYASGAMVNGAINWANTATSARVLTGATGCTVSALVASGEGIVNGELELFVEYVLY